LLQLIECIEPLKTDVKKKKGVCCALERCTKVTNTREKKNFRRRKTKKEFSREKNLNPASAQKNFGERPERAEGRVAPDSFQFGFFCFCAHL